MPILGVCANPFIDSYHPSKEGKPAAETTPRKPSRATKAQDATQADDPAVPANAGKVGLRSSSGSVYRSPPTRPQTGRN